LYSKALASILEMFADKTLNNQWVNFFRTQITLAKRKGNVACFSLSINKEGFAMIRANPNLI